MPKKPPLLLWISAYLLLGLGVLCVLAYFKALHDVPVEKNLVALEGVPNTIWYKQVTGRRGIMYTYLHFNINGNELTYADTSPLYEDLRSAISAGQSVKAWVAKRWLLFHGEDLVLCKLETAKRVVLPFSVSSESHEQNLSYNLLGMLVFIGGGIVQLFINFRKARLYKEWAKANPDKVPVVKSNHARCPECNAKVQIPPEFGGQNVRCPSCHAVYLAADEPE